ncbi:hypothetical protein [Klebsiella quasipneumoniae]|uniref:hypothetical protein n=1 Tax=Klebsiella quasipneumoniae TaxID=1463165 RepID=UPI00388E0CCD
MCQTYGTGSGTGYTSDITFNIGGQEVTRRIFVDAGNITGGTTAFELRFAALWMLTTTMSASLSERQVVLPRLITPAQSRTSPQPHFGRTAVHLANRGPVRAFFFPENHPEQLYYGDV